MRSYEGCGSKNDLIFKETEKNIERNEDYIYFGNEQWKKTVGLTYEASMCYKSNLRSQEVVHL